MEENVNLSLDELEKAGGGISKGFYMYVPDIGL